MKTKIILLFTVLISLSSCLNSNNKNSENSKKQKEDPNFPIIIAENFGIESYFQEKSQEKVYLKGTLIFKNNTSDKIKDFKFQIDQNIIMKDGKETNIKSFTLYDYQKQIPERFYAGRDNLLKGSEWGPSEKFRIDLTTVIHTVSSYNKDNREKYIKDFFSRTPKIFRVKYSYYAVSLDNEYKYESGYIDVLNHWKDYQKKLGIR